MVTDAERREVAARLRELHLGGGSKDLIELTLSDAIGAWRESGMSWDFITERLADLIEPEPERTCRMEYAGEVPPSVRYSCYFCSECGSPIYNDMEPSYCPYCGAKVKCAAEIKVDGERLEKLAHDAAVELTGVDRDALMALADEMKRMPQCELCPAEIVDCSAHPDGCPGALLDYYARRIRKACGEVER